MPVVIQSTAYRLLREAADQYIRQGYSVQIQPLDEDLPPFLKGFRPDMIVTTPDGHLIVEIKSSSGKRDTGYWQQLEKALEGHSGWRVQLVLDDRRAEEMIGATQPVLSPEEREARLCASRQLADDGLLDSALVVAWTALEAELRDSSRAQNLNIPNQGPGPLITVLYAEGDLEREDYDALMQILDAYKEAAHGFRSDRLDRSLLDQAQSIAQRLMRQQHIAA